MKVSASLNQINIYSHQVISINSLVIVYLNTSIQRDERQSSLQDARSLFTYIVFRTHSNFLVRFVHIHMRWAFFRRKNEQSGSFGGWGGVGWGKMDKSKTGKVAVLEVKLLGHIHPPRKKTAPLSILFRSVLHKTPFVPS